MLRHAALIQWTHGFADQVRGLPVGKCQECGGQSCKDCIFLPVQGALTNSAN